MKLYVSTTTERATKGQGGNKYLTTNITDAIGNRIISIYASINVKDATITIKNWAKNTQDIMIVALPPKGNKQKDEVYKIRCNNCMNIYTEEELINIGEAKACPICQSDNYLMDKYE